VSIVGFYRSNQITFGSRDDRLYGLNTETTEYGFRKFLIDANGISEISVTPDFIPGWHGLGGSTAASTRTVARHRAGDSEDSRNVPLTFDDYDRSVRAGHEHHLLRLEPLLHLRDPLALRYENVRVPGSAAPARRVRRATGAVRWGAHGLAYFTFDFFSETGRVYVLDGIDDPPNADLAMTVRETADPSAIGTT
jgi:hypothetical protein